MPERLPVPLRHRQRAERFLWLLPVLLAVAALPRDPRLEGAAGPALDALLLLLAALVALLLASVPRRLAYALTPATLEIHRFSGTRTVPLVGLSARSTSGRLGVGMPAAYLPGYLTGRFRLQHDEGGVGQVEAAASARQGGVLLLGGSSVPLFLTPADPEGFLRALAERGVQVER